MVLSMERYRELREEFLRAARKDLTSADLDELKTYYEQQINSVRTSDRIQNIDNLVRVLEKRGVIRYNNIADLKYIAKYFPRSSITEKLNQYDVSLENYNSHCPPNTNLYRIPNGECFLRSKHYNDLASTNSKTKSSDDSNLQFYLKYQFAYKLPFHVISDKDSNNSDNSISSTVSQNDRCNAKVLFQSNFISNKNRDLNIIDENLDNGELQVSHNITIPSNLISKSKQTVVLKNNASTPLLIEKNVNATVESSFSPIPQSSESQTVHSSRIGDTLWDQSCINLNPTINLNKKDSLKQLLQKRKVRMVLIIIFIGIMLSTIFIIYHLLEASAQYNPEPSAPPSQEAYFGSTESFRNSHAGNQSPWNPDTMTGLQQHSHGYALRNVTCFPVIPRSNLKILSEQEEMKQQMVFERVSEMMGRYWREVARQLHVRECEIDEIEQYNCTITVKAYTALKIFARDSDPNDWQWDLKKALREARRNDLSELVEKLLTRR